MKFSGEPFLPGLPDLPETGSTEWTVAALEFAERCAKLETSILVVCKACGWHHESKTLNACLSCNGPLEKAEFGEHERAAVLSAMHRLEIERAAGSKQLILG